MGPLGGQEMIVIFILALLLFGPKKLPELGRMLGKAITEFRRAKNELKATLETHLSELEKETQPSAKPAAASTDYSSVQYPYAYDEYGQYGDYSSSYGSNEAPQIQETGHSNSAVPGTVPRQNGVQPADGNKEPLAAPHSDAVAEEEHSS
jgi:sec-independent protein translocase protein TatA